MDEHQGNFQEVQTIRFILVGLLSGAKSLGLSGTSFLFPLLLITLSGAVSVGCASYTEETKEIRSLYRSSAYESALEKLESSSVKSSEKNRLLYAMEKGAILDRMGKHKDARTTLLDADRLADELYTVSISRTTTSFIVSESSTDYEGEDFEKVAIHTILALSFIGTGEIKSALVQARKINSKLNEINQRYEDNKNQYGEDAFARFLAGLVYESQKEWDSAIIDYAKALELYEGTYSKFASGVPRSLIDSYVRVLTKRNRTDRLKRVQKKYKKHDEPDDKDGYLAVIHEVGHITTKATKEYPMQIGKQIVRFSFPYYRKVHGSYSGATGVKVGKGGKFHSGYLVQDMDAIAVQTLEDRRLRLVAKQTARLLVKGQLTEQAYEKFGLVGGIAANVFSAVTETADTRSWTLLPESFYITRVRLPAGKSKVVIKTGGRTSEAQIVDIKPGQLTLLRAY